MRKNINSNKNQYKVRLHASSCKVRSQSHGQSWGPLLAGKDIISLPTLYPLDKGSSRFTDERDYMEQGGSVIKKGDNVFSHLEKTRNLKTSTRGRQPSLHKRKSVPLPDGRLYRRKGEKEAPLHIEDSLDPSLIDMFSADVGDIFSFSSKEKKEIKNHEETKSLSFSGEKRQKRVDGQKTVEEIENRIYQSKILQGNNHQLMQLIGFSSHFGRKSRDLDFAFPWHASMCNKFSGIRNKVPYISSEQTLRCLVEAFYCIALILRKGGKVLVVNRNDEFSALFHTNNFSAGSHLPNKNVLSPKKEKARNLQKKSNPLSFVAKEKETTSMGPQNFRREDVEYRNKCRPATAPLKWVGGCLTNWKEISKSAATLLYFSKRFGRFIKENNIHFPRFKKMRASFQGFIDVEREELLLKAPPQLLFLFNAHESQQILHEAVTLQIPIVALTDSSTDLSQITYPIPINSDSARLVHRCLSQLMQITDRQGGFTE